MENVDEDHISTKSGSASGFLLDLITDDNETTSNVIMDQLHFESKNAESNKSGFLLDDKIIIEDDNSSGGEEKEEVSEGILEDMKKLSQAARLGKLNRMPRKFTIASDIEEIDEELEEDEMFESQIFQPSKIIEEIHLLDGEDFEQVRVSQGRSKQLERAASMLEQRLKMIGSLRQLVDQRRMLKTKNNLLHKKCCQFLEKSMAMCPHLEPVEGALPLHGNERYYAVLEDFEVTQSHYETAKPILEIQSQELANSYDFRKKMFDQVFKDLVDRELEIGLNFINGKAEKSSNYRVIYSLTNKQQTKFGELSKARVPYIKMKNLLSTIEMKLRRANIMGEGRTLLDYEQLTIKKHSLMDKLDERDEELRKFTIKCTDYISIFSHLKETADAFVWEIANAAFELEQTMKMKKRARSLLAVEGTKRDSLRNDMSRLHNIASLLANPRLLKKMNDAVKSLDVLKLKVKTRMESNSTLMDDDNVRSEKETQS